MFCSCNPSQKITSFVKPLRVVKNDSSYSLFSTDVNFLFVLDDSESMNEHYKTMAENFKHFLPLIEEHPYYSYNFAVTTLASKSKYEEEQQLPLVLTNTRHLNDCVVDYESFLKKTSLGFYFHYESGVFKYYNFDDLICLISRNISTLPQGDGNEYYFHSLNYILDWNSSEDFHSKFFSPEGFLIIIFVSDTVGGELISAYETVENEDKVNKEFILRGRGQLQKIINRKKKDNIKIYAIVPEKDDTCGEGLEYNWAPVHVQSLALETKGKVFSICEKDWGKKLNIISNDLIQFVRQKEIFLDEVPLLSTIEVYFNNKKIPQSIKRGWYYDPEKVAIYISDGFNIYDYLQQDGDNSYIIKYHPLNLEVLYDE